jgi:hypothetical protein
MQMLLPRQMERTSAAQPVQSAMGLSPYANSALNRACRQIVAAPEGQQEATLNGEAFAIGTLAAAGAVPPRFARSVVLYAAWQVRDHDPRRPWLLAEIERKVNRAFDAGMIPSYGRRAKPNRSGIASRRGRPTAQIRHDRGFASD